MTAQIPKSQLDAELETLEATRLESYLTLSSLSIDPTVTLSVPTG